MKKVFSSNNNKTSLAVKSALWLSIGLITASFYLVPVVSATDKARVTDAFCLNYNFSSMSGPGQIFQSVHDAQLTCQALVNEATKWSNQQALLSDSTFLQGFLQHINQVNSNSVFSVQAQEIDPQITVAGSCTNPDAATLQSGISQPKLGTQAIQVGNFGITAKVFQYQLSQPHSCVYSAIWNFSQIPSMQKGGDMSKCLLGIPYPANVQNTMGGVNPRHLAFQLNSYGSVADERVFTNEQLLFSMKVPFPIQSITAQLETSVVAGQRVDLPAIYLLCAQSPATVTPTTTPTLS